jgi:hypothetical protein
MSEEKGIETSDQLQVTSNTPVDKEEHYAIVNKQLATMEPQTSNLKPETTNMETHAHHLHKAPGKNFWHYFFEFLMLFLAISLGFYAETLRENIKNKKEIQEDMQSIVADLSYDSRYFDSLIARNEYSCSMTDSLVRLLSRDRSNTSDIYYVARTVTANFGYFFSNAKTFDQMKSSGMLRHIRPRKILDSIANYYSSIQWLSNQTELVRMKVDGIHLGNSQLFNGFVFENMMQIDYGNFQRGIISIKKPDGNPPLLTNDIEKINDVVTRYHYFFSTTKFYDKTASQVSQEAKRLIGLIKNEYHQE